LINNRKYLFTVFFVALASALGVWGCGHAKSGPATRADDLIVEERQMMGATVQIQAIGPTAQAREAVEAAFRVIAEIESWAHPDRPSSDVAQINAAAGARPVAVHDEIFAMLRTSREVSEASDGAYDITFAGAGKLWDIQHPDKFRIPTDEEVRESVRLVNYRNLELDEAAKTAFLKEEGMRIGLGAIAKGWAADKAMEALKARGINNAIVSPGGNLLVAGTKRGKPWHIGIQHPRKPKGTSLAVLRVRGDLAVLTAGDYERFVIRAGVRYNHILDPHSGRPTDRCQGVTIIGPRAGVADALDTACFVLGPPSCLTMMRDRYPGYEAFIVDADGKTAMSPGFKQKAEFREVD
jgi:thiamine biosynthesis lipoprotein